MTRLVVLGDSVPAGERTDGPGWPRRLPRLLEELAEDDVSIHGGMGTSLAELATDAEEVLPDAPSGDLLVVVHAGHNDAQLRGGEPRVDPSRVRAAAATLDGLLSARADRYTFLGLVPLLSLEEPGAVPFSDAQPERSLEYDEILAETVGTHLPVAEPVGAWRERTVDGVHPGEAGHAYLAEQVADWLSRS